MAMFGSKDKEQQIPAAPTGGGAKEKRINSVIGEGSAFSGTLRIDGSLIIHGDFEGAVTCTDTLVVGKTGRVKAEIDVQGATIGGRVEGRIFAKERVELQTGCHFLGDVHSRSFVIQDGVFFQGNCTMGEASTSTPVAKEAAGGSRQDLGILKQP
jgi:cytoskeletal protein CcmA (bactofilin family)